jgi:hypothetical protein
MNDEKVYIEGYVVGFMADATGTREKQIQVSSGETVSIDESFIHKSITSEKVKIPQMVADWIDACKENLAIGLYTAMNPDFLKQWNKSDKLISWSRKISNQELFARAWLDGYTVEKEKRYIVRIKGVEENSAFLNYYAPRNEWHMNSSCDMKDIRAFHTRKELEEAGFGWAFYCEGVEVQEVE